MDQTIDTIKGSKQKELFATLAAPLAASGFAGVLTIINSGRHSYWFLGAFITFSIGIPALCLSILSLKDFVQGFAFEHGPNRRGMWILWVGTITNLAGISFLFGNYNYWLAISFGVVVAIVVFWVDIADRRVAALLETQKQDAEAKSTDE